MANKLWVKPRLAIDPRRAAVGRKPTLLGMKFKLVQPRSNPPNSLKLRKREQMIKLLLETKLEIKFNSMLWKPNERLLMKCFLAYTCYLLDVGLNF